MNRGCQWEGTIGTLKQHVDTCEFALVPCPKECKDCSSKVNDFMRRDLVEHLERDCPNRDYICQYCEEQGTYDEIAKIHDETCEKKILPCSNAGCTQTMERQQITEHVRTQCPYTVISCKYKGIGCTSQLKRRDVVAHEKDDHLHLHMALDVVNMLLEKVNKDPVSMTFAVQDYQEKSKAGAEFISPSFYTHPNGYRMEVRVHWSRRDNVPVIDLSAKILDGAYDASLKWPFRGKITIELLNQLEDKKHQAWTTSIPEGGVDSNLTIYIHDGSWPWWNGGRLTLDRVKNTQYLMDDTLYFRVSVEVADHKPWLQCTATTN